MGDAVIFVLIFGGFFILRAIAATIVFYFLLPEGDRCPNCDAPTLRVQSPGWNRVVPQVRTSWCYECDWHGLLRHGDVTPAASAPQRSKAARP